MQQFEGQYHDEKVLFKKHESKASLIIRNLPKYLALIIIALIASIVSYYASENILYPSIIASIALMIFIIMTFIISVFHKQTYFAFTNKRAVKAVRNGLFSSHLKELKIENIKQTTSNNSGMFARIFGYGNINVQGPEDATSLYFRAITENKNLVLYISRMIDYIKKDGPEAELYVYESNYNKK